MKRAITSIVFLVHFCVFSQEHDFNNFIHLSVSEGLSQSTVVAVEQDQFDQMWIGTRDGLNKYDGEEITIYRNNPKDSTSLSNNDILSIKEDKEGFIWIGTYNGLNKFDPRTEKFTRFLYSSKKNTISHRSIRAIKEMKNNTLWFATSDGLFIYNRKNDELIHYDKDENTPSQLRSDFIIDIYQDKTDDIWIATSLGLHKVVNSEIDHLKFERFNREQGTDSNIFIQTINEDANGNLWIGTKFNGLLVFNTTNKRFVSYNELNDKKIKSTDIRSLKYDKDSNLWIGTYDGVFIKKANNELIKIINQPGNPDSLSKNSIKEIFIDKNGSVWIGTYYGGINLWDIHNNNFHELYLTKGEQSYHLGVVSSIVEDKNGSFFIGTEGNGVTVIQKNGKTNSVLTNALNKKVKNSNIKSLLLDDQTLWIGTLKGGIKEFNIVTQEFNESSHLELKDILSNQGVYAIQKIRNLLVFGTFGRGAVIYDRITKKISFIQPRVSDINSLTNRRIRSMFSDQLNNLWIGTDKGLNKVSYKELTANTPVLKRFLFEDDIVYGHNILCIYQDHQGSIFVGTKEKGIQKLVKDKFEPFKIELINADITTVYSIVEDDQKYLWISSNLGLVCYDPVTKKTILYDQAQGFWGNEFINNSYLKGSNGHLYFGGVKGVAFFNPKTLGKSNYKSKVVLTGITVNGKDPNKNIAFINQITLEHDENSFSLNFALPSYINTTDKRYAYRLKGLNDEWKFTTNNEASYTIQKPGDYIFEVKKINNENVLKEAFTSINIRVKAAFWKTKWAFLIYMILTILILHQIYINITARITLAHKLKSERLENTRQEEINTSKLEFFTNISHDFRTPLTLILAPLQQLIERYNGSSDMYTKLLLIERNAKQLLKLTNQLLDFRAFENKHSKLEAREDNLVRFLDGIYRSFQEYAKIGNYKYSFDSSSESILVFYDEIKLEKAFYNVLSNAFKYTPKGGEIGVKIYETDKEVFIEISDNGAGVDNEFMNKIFDRYYEMASKVEYQKHFNQGNGIGLHIAKKTLDLHKGKIAVKSEKKKGTTFIITLKKGRDHLTESEIITGKQNNKDSIEYKDYSNFVENIENINLNTLSLSTKKTKILVVEDNHEFRKFIVNLLGELYSVEQAENGDAGFKMALKVFPDLIISDVIMPKMEGTEFCSKIKNDKRTSHIPFILLTSRSSIEHKFIGLESGADRYIDKPFNIKEFLLVIKNLLKTTEHLKSKFIENNANFEDNRIDSEEENMQRKAIRIVEHHIDDPSFDIQYFSSELGLSRTMLFVKIKAWTNLTPKEFINSIRMKKAAEFLEIGGFSISEIGYKVGFKDPKYFSKSFKKYYKKTPSEYAETFYS
ncbi:hybrid sensor histidine kinase/response regulator transcription factor [Aquimarina aggregata]|uniref:hybrid sensor histidine kinase/response regulator transcription factor n=1 Tax=Aquimarina aggregata TaxID=1642818 RepID=UPI002491A0BD|nr:two-component regulator propeller domain-containing protein [Aquimarina aggregata]